MDGLWGRSYGESRQEAAKSPRSAELDVMHHRVLAGPREKITLWALCPSLVILTITSVVAVRIEAGVVDCGFSLGCRW